MSEVEALADIAAGGVIARAVEPRAGDGTDNPAHPATCLNCATALTGDYCHVCGQAAHVHRTLGAFWHDFLHGVLHFEGKVWRTLPMLAWHPGALTRRYVAGERARFVSPLALFLFCVFLTFAVIGITGAPFGSTDVVNEGIDDGIATVDREIADLEKQRAAAIAERRDVAGIDKRLKNERDEASLLRLMKERGVTEATMVRVSDDLPSDLGLFNDVYRKAKANPALLIYKLQNNAYKYSWALIPISIPFMWLLFPFSRRFRMYDHAIFITYSLCFMTLLLIVASLANAAKAPQALVSTLIGIVPPLHIYRQLRGAYRLRWWSALLRTAVLLIFCTITSTLFVTMLVGLGVLT